MGIFFYILPKLVKGFLNQSGGSIMFWESLALKFRNVPQNAESVLEPFSREMVQKLGEDLLCVAVYGSAASGDYIYGRSNINMLLVLKEVSVSQLKQIAVPVEKWMVRGFASPLIVTPKDLERSLDAFPLLFTEIRDNHRVLHGEDLLKGLKIAPGDLRVQVEQFLRGKLTEARSEFLASGESLKTFEDMISKSFNSVVPLLRALLSLSGETPSIRKDVIVAYAEEKFKLEGGVLTDALRHKMGLFRLSDKHNLLAYFERYMVAIARLAEIADTLEVKK